MDLQKTKEIKGKTYQVAPFMAVEGLRLKAYLVKLFGPALAELTGLSKGLDSEVSELSVVIEKLTSVLNEDTFIALIKRLFANVVVNWTDKNDGQRKAIAFTPDFDSAMNVVFQGELFSIYPVIAFVLEVNYPDFFPTISPFLTGKKMNPISMSGKAEK